MKRVFEKSIYCIATTLLLLIATNVTAGTVILGYCDNEIKSTDFRDKMDEDVPIKGAIKFTASQLAAYKGAKITKIRIGAEEGLKDTELWISTSLNEPATVTQQLGTTKEGWNELTLTTPYIITGEEIYVGFSCTLPAGKNIILNGKTNSNGGFLWMDDGWDDLSVGKNGSLLIQAVVETEGEVKINDLGIESLMMDSKFVKNEETRKFMATVGNYGTSSTKLPTIHYQIGNTAEQQYSEDKTIEPGSNYTVNFSGVTEGLSEGKNTLKVWIDVNDDIEENNSITADMYAYTKSYPRKLLLEQFTTINCTNCPAGDRALNSVLNGKNNVAWVAHHVGFGTDELTVSPSESIMEFGVNSAPLAMFDRSILPVSENNTPLFSISYEPETLSKQYVGLAYNFAAIQPSFTSVNIDAEYDEAARNLNIKVSGEKNNDIYKLLYDKAAITVYITEDNVKAQQLQVGGGADAYYHDHVLREALTAPFGDDITWTGNTYTASYSTTLNKNWKPENTHIIAFVSRKYEGDPNNAEVLNTNDFKISTLTGIKGIENNGEKTAARRYFTLQGQPVNAADMQVKGVYIEQTKTANGTTSKKVVME